MLPNLPWIVALAALALLAAAGWSIRARRTKHSAPLPTDWPLSARPVFSTDERRVHRLLREALPHHVVLSKLPLVRFCQPNDPKDVRYWYDLLGSAHVAFAVCSPNGRVLAAIDLDTDRGNSRRVLQIKQSVLAACRVRYLRCPVERLPSVAELQLLVPQGNGATRGPHPAPPPTHNLHQARDTLSNTVAHRRAERTALWQDSTHFQDSFFAPDSRIDGQPSEYGGLSNGVDTSGRPLGGFADSRSPTREDDSEIVGVVVDTPPASRH